MPKLPVPHRSDAHRLACLSLYRALLKQSFALPSTQSAGVTSLIRYRFKTDRVLQSPSQIADGLRAGNDVLNLLCACAQGRMDSIARLSSLIESTLKLSESNKVYRSALRSSRSPAAPRPGPKAVTAHLGASRMSHSGRLCTGAVFSRPLPLSQIRGGKRRVPRFVSVQGIPFLRYSKPQSPTLGRVLRQKIAWNIKKWDQRGKLAEVNIRWGENEDAWDALVTQQHRKEVLQHERSTPGHVQTELNCELTSWAAASRVADAAIGQKIRNQDLRNAKTSQRMVDILKQERMLAAKEKADLESKKYERRVARRTEGLLAAAAPNQRSEEDDERT